VVSATDVEWDSVCEENPPELSATVVAELIVWEVPSATPHEWLSVWDENEDDAENPPEENVSVRATLWVRP